MKYFWTFFWTFALVQMATYVGSSMIGTAYNFMTGTTIAVIAALLILIIPAIIPNETKEKYN